LQQHQQQIASHSGAYRRLITAVAAACASAVKVLQGMERLTQFVTMSFSKSRSHEDASRRLTSSPDRGWPQSSDITTPSSLCMAAPPCTDDHRGTAGHKDHRGDVDIEVVSTGSSTSDNSDEGSNYRSHLSAFTSGMHLY